MQIPIAKPKQKTVTVPTTKNLVPKRLEWLGIGSSFEIEDLSLPSVFVEVCGTVGLLACVGGVFGSLVGVVAAVSNE
jgi:hypothetical protein